MEPPSQIPADAEAPVPAPVATKKKPPAKKSAASKKKPASSAASAEAPVSIDLDSQWPADDGNIILQLKVPPSGDASSDGGRDPPDAYNQENCMEFEAVQQNGGNAGDSSSAAASTDGHQAGVGVGGGPILRRMELLGDFAEKSKNGEWPGSTSVCCHWCCHQFEGPPVGVPVKHVDGVFHVCGCFCSLECAMAHNYASNDGMDEIWERNSLLQLMGRRMNKEGPVVSAPPRVCLRMFGGYMDIEDFRKHCESRRVVTVNCPPMLSLTQQVDELYESDLLTHDYKYVPLDNARVDEYRKKLRLKRNKPLVNPKNTLDYAMNVKIST